MPFPHQLARVTFCDPFGAEASLKTMRLGLGDDDGDDDAGLS